MTLSDVKKDVTAHILKGIELDQKMKEFFNEGREIVFRLGYMTENHNAVVLSSGFHTGRDFIYIRDQLSGLKMEISLGDVQGA